MADRNTYFLSRVCRLVEIHMEGVDVVLPGKIAHSGNSRVVTIPKEYADREILIVVKEARP